MKYQGIIIAIIACIGLLLFAVIFTNNQAKLTLERDAAFQQKENQQKAIFQKCIEVGTLKVEQDACSFYKMPYPCKVPNIGLKGENEGIQYVNDYCQKMYGKQ